MARRGSSSAGFFIIFGLIWTGIVGTFDVIIIYGAVRQVQAESYVTTTGTVTRSEVVNERDSEGDLMYRAEIAYRYTVDSRSYSSERYRYGGFTSSSDSSQARRIVGEHPAGAEVAVYYNPQDHSDSVLVTGIQGQDLFMSLFLAPFNVIMLGIWLFLFGVLKRKITKPPAGGVKIIRRPNATYVRLPRVSPLVGAGITALVISFISIFVVAFGMGMDPSIPVIETIWGCVLVPAVGVYFWKMYRIGTGRKDLVIDHANNMLSLPETFGRKEDVAVAIEQVRAIEVEEIVHHGSKGGTSYTYAPTLKWTDESGKKQSDKLAEWQNKDRAEALVDWLSGKIAER